MKFINKNELFLLEEVVKKNFASKYKDSYLGIFWSILRPLLMMILFTIIFSTLFGRNIEYFPVYFLSARCLFDFFNSSVSASMNSIKKNKTIIKTTAAPKHIFVLGGIISEFLNFFISVLLLFGVMIVLKVPFYLNVMPFAIIPVISLIIMLIGLGLALSIVCVYYTDIQHLWGLFSIIIMYSSALFYPMEIIPEPFQSIFLLNPFYWIVSQFRCLLYQGIFPSILNIVDSLLISSMILLIGVIIFKKYEKKVSMKF